jgi:hypothetical protein
MTPAHRNPRAREAAGRLAPSMAELQIEARRIIRRWPALAAVGEGSSKPVDPIAHAFAVMALREVNARIHELRASEREP